MATFKGKEGRWITTKEGRHLFIEEDGVDRQERQIKERAQQTEQFTMQQNQLATPVDYSKSGSRSAAVQQFEQDTGVKVTFDPNDDKVCTKTNLYMVLNTVAEMKQKYPQQLRFLKSVDAYTDPGSILGVSMACANPNHIKINTEVFSKHNPQLQKMYASGTFGNTPYHPKGTTAKDIITHELGHVMFFEHLGRMNRRLTKHDFRDEFDYLTWANNKGGGTGKTATYVADEINKALATALGSQPKHNFLGYANPKFKHPTAISGYAATCPHELMAEAVADYMANGSNASPFSKELVKILNL